MMNHVATVDAEPEPCVLGDAEVTVLFSFICSSAIGSDDFIKVYSFASRRFLSTPSRPALYNTDTTINHGS
jgi:hypothetical protein